MEMTSEVKDITHRKVHLKTWQIALDYGSPKPERIKFIKGNTIVWWRDGTVTSVKCKKGDKFSEELGFIYALAKKVYDGRGQYLKLIEEAELNSQTHSC